MSLQEIAKQLNETDENINLIYAFNSIGKTRLSVAYKDYSKELNNGIHSGVYYNAYSEDLFVWDNDEENDNVNLRLKVIPSTLNQFHSLLSSKSIEEKLQPFNPKFNFKFNQFDDEEKGIESISFVFENEKEAIKISRGEERIFVWCFFLALFDIDGWANQQNAHFFIDDPVSSLDDHNIFVTADTIFKIIEDNYLKKRIIIATHHIGLFSILADRLKKGEKSGKYKNLAKLLILNSHDNKLELKSPNNDVFLFHLHLIQTLDLAIKNKLYVYHFVLLRQILENICSFLGKGGINYTLAQIGIAKIEDTANVINSLSHKDAYRLQFNEMSPTEEEVFKDIFQKILVKYNFKF